MPISDSLNKKELQIILEVNQKAIEIETEVADQNEKILAMLSANKNIEEANNSKLDKLITKSEDLSRDLFKIQVLFTGSFLTLIAQIVQMFLHK